MTRIGADNFFGHPPTKGTDGNEGHEFTAVMTDEERIAVIEYLKTL
ncbi:hypothetical protein [Ketobacter sp.]